MKSSLVLLLVFAVSVYGAIEGEIEEELTEDWLESLKKAFVFYDKDGDGQITAKELGTVLSSLGENPTESELQDMIKEVDADRNGNMDYSDFATMMTQSKNDTDPEEDIRRMVMTFDKDNNGFISKDEFRHEMMNLSDELTEKEVNEEFDEADTDGDGKINYDHLGEMLKAFMYSQIQNMWDFYSVIFTILNCI